MLKRTAPVALVSVLLASPTFAVVDVVVDHFDTYADTSALLAAWGETIGNGTAPVTSAADHFAGILTSDAGLFPGIEGKAVDHVGAMSSTPGMVNQWGGVIDQTQGFDPAFTIHPTASLSVVLSADLFVPLSGNERMTVGLRSVTVSPDGPDAGTAPDISTVNILEMGLFNAAPAATPVVPGAPTVSTGFAYRLVEFGPVTSPVTAQPNWQYFALAPQLDRPDDIDLLTNIADIGAGWHTFTATITPTSITLTLDLFRDGKVNLTRDDLGVFVGVGEDGVDASITYDIETLPAGFNALRIGGPSGLTSPGPGVTAFDNISLQLVPEPASTALLACAGLIALGRRR